MHGVRWGLVGLIDMERMHDWLLIGKSQISSYEERLRQQQFAHNSRIVTNQLIFVSNPELGPMCSVLGERFFQCLHRRVVWSSSLHAESSALFDKAQDCGFFVFASAVT